MQNNWVDFKAVKAAVSMQMVLDRYQVNWLGRKGEELRGRCPIHQGDGQGAFHVNLAKNAFHCFSCKARGNVLDFVAAMEKCSVRDAGLKLQDWFSISAEVSSAKPKPEGGGVEQEPAINKPLSFQLAGIDHGHEYLKARGIAKKVARTFGVGYFSGKGSVSGRVVIPIHNERGELVAYAGRAIDDSEPRYKLPAGFHKSQVLYNLHRATGPDVIIVEGFFDCIKVHQAGFSNVVALMGSTLSQEQHKLLSRFQKVTLMLDGDEPGHNATQEIARLLMASHFIKAVSLTQNVQPDQLSTEQLAQLLEVVLVGWTKKRPFLDRAAG